MSRIRAQISPVSNEEMLRALKRSDAIGRAQGEEPSARSLLNVGRALEEFGVTGFSMTGSDRPEIVKQAQELNAMLFMPRDLQGGGVHLGAFLFKDMFCRLYAPIVFGRPYVDFWKLTDLNDVQKAWLAEDEDDLARFTDQAADVFDFGYGFMEFGHGRSIDARSKDLIWRSHVQLESAAATATAAYDYRGTTQSAILGTELALKAGLAACGIPDRELSSRMIGHNLVAASHKLGALCPKFDTSRVERVVSSFPDYVSSRYIDKPLGREETGHLVMGAQYVASEVTRQFSDRDIRKEDNSFQSRQYPP